MSFPITYMRTERKKLGWTLQYVADKIGISNPAVFAIETLGRKPSYDVIIRLEGLFNQPHWDLFKILDETRESNYAEATTLNHSNIRQAKGGRIA